MIVKKLSLFAALLLLFAAVAQPAPMDWIRPNQTSQQCQWFDDQRVPFYEIDTADLYSAINRANPLANYPVQRKSGEKLHVIIVPHSHNDAGWYKPIEYYFESDTKFILDNVVRSLSENVARKFIWAETSFLAIWWAQADEQMRSMLRRLIVDTKQLEIVTGGWVMNDEADTHYFAMIEQMIEGHEWLRANINESLAPRNAWAIDPFGYSPTMAYLLKQMGFDSMTITRVHYVIREELARAQLLEFNWRQSWSTPASKPSDIFCHLMPYEGYTVSETCGPSKEVCCQFDFLRLSNAFGCPDEAPVPIFEINEQNVQERAALLLDQYRQKSKLFRHNVVLVPLGADFRYKTMVETDDQFNNYERLMNYMNSRVDWNVEARFGTLDDYFRMAIPSMAKIATLKGDFFTYADKGQEYWSGYFTSRPYQKRLGRVAETYLRAAEILFSYVRVFESTTPQRVESSNELSQQLTMARQNMSVFQHHDGITGTSKSFVVRDFESKLKNSLESSKTVIEQSASLLLAPGMPKGRHFRLDDSRVGFVSEIDLLKADDEQNVVLFNPGTSQRDEVVAFRINTPHVQVFDSAGARMDQLQISLIWPNSSRITTDSDDDDDDDDETVVKRPKPLGLDFEDKGYELLFQVSLPALTFKTFTLRRVEPVVPAPDVFSKTKYLVKTLNPLDRSAFQREIRQRLNLPDGIESDLVTLSSLPKQNTNLEVSIGAGFTAIVSLKSGLLQEILTPSQRRLKVQVDFKTYRTIQGGAYLFMAEDEGKVLGYAGLFKWLRIEEGPLRRRICSELTVVRHCVEFYPSLLNDSELPSVRVSNVVDLVESWPNTELSMVVESEIDDQGLFHTDLNGFQFMQRKRLQNLPVQANVFPMPTGAFIQDQHLRMNLLTAQSLGVTSLKPSTLEVFLDRRMNQDDHKGLSEGIEDNRQTPSNFAIVFESINPNAARNQAQLQYPSIYAQMLSFDLLNPVVKLVEDKFFRIRPSIDLALVDDGHSIPCDLQLVNMRSTQQHSSIGLIFHRLAHDDCPTGSAVLLPEHVQVACQRSQPFPFRKLFRTPMPPIVEHTDLTLRSKNQKILSADSAIEESIQPMQIEAFLFRLF